MIGSTLSHYEITAELGRGGMGVVYRGRDTKLDREVAIKVLPSSALASDDDRARFYREAKAAAALNHPNIAQIYEIDEAVPSDAPHGTRPSPFIAMEYIDGEPLDTRIKRGPLKLSEAVRLATQIAGALGAAHEKGIVHRDVKASNVMLTSKGDAKVLDFGLALTAASTKLTRTGSTLGTVAYMSPEQARGEEVDRRTDLWALGVVLYEMVAGRNPFVGEYEQAVVYSILNAEPEPLTAVRTGVPMELEAIVSKILRKDCELRYQSAAGLVADLKGINFSSGSLGRSPETLSAPETPPGSDAPEENTFSKLLPLAAIPVAVLFLAAGYFMGKHSDDAQSTLENPVIRAEIPLPDIQNLISIDVTGDGRHLAFIGATANDRTAGVRDLTTGRINPIEDADGATEVTVSSDGQWVYLTNPQSVARVSINGGRAQEFIGTGESFPQAGAGSSTLTLFEDFQSIWVYDESTQERRLLVADDSLQGVADLDWPRLLPDEETVLATIEYADSRVAIGFWDLESGDLRATYEPGGYRARVLNTGHLLFFQSGYLMAAPFDAKRLRTTAAPIPLMRLQSRSLFTVSDGGILIVGRASDSARLTPANETFPHEIRMYDFRSLNANALPVPAGLYGTIDSDPTGTQLAVTRYDGTGQSDVWVQLITEGGQFQVTSDGRSNRPKWFAGGDSLLFVRKKPATASEREDELIVASATGGSAEPVFYSQIGAEINHADISEDGRTMIYSQSVPGSVGQGSSVLRVERGSGIAVPIFRDTRLITTVELSPDSRYVALSIDGQVYVIPSEPGGGPSSVSDGPGLHPNWSHDGEWIYFIRDQELVRVPVRLQPGFSRTGSAEVLIETNAAPTHVFDVLGIRPVAAVVEYALGTNVAETDGAPAGSSLELLINLPREIERIEASRN